MKEDFFSKFKDYNKELEKILEHKDFSKDTKNLLLSMFYKLEASYNDYYTVKKNCVKKQEYLENILDNIKNSNGIDLVKTNDEEFDKFKEKQYEIDLKLRKIKVIPNELALLSAILELNDFEIKLNEKYNLLRNSMPYLLNTAYDMENIEALRDFNAWSWNTLVKEIKDININLVYQNLKIALDCNIFGEIETENEYNDILKIIEDKLRKKYDEKDVEIFLKLIYKISVLKYTQISDNEKKRLLEEKENISIELNEIKDKKKYIDSLTKEKRRLNVELKEIDLILNSKVLLIKEFEERNSVLPDYKKMFSLSHLAEKLQKDRKKILNKIEVCNINMQPKNYLSNKHKLQEDYELLLDIEENTDVDIYKYIDKLQKIFLSKIFKAKIENSATKEELVNCMYELRYYNFLMYNKEKTIKDLRKFKLNIDELEEIIIKRFYASKIINAVSTNEKINIEIIKRIFELKIISLENIYIEIRKNKEIYELKIYDEKETLDTEYEFQLELGKKDKIKLNKKIKLFI